MQLEDDTGWADFNRLDHVSRIRAKKKKNKTNYQSDPFDQKIRGSMGTY